MTDNKVPAVREAALHTSMFKNIEGAKVVLHEHLEDEFKKKLEGLSTPEILQFVLSPESRKAGVSVTRRGFGDTSEYVVVSKKSRKDEHNRQNTERVDKVLGRMVEILPAFSDKAEEIKKEINSANCVGCKLNSVMARARVAFVAACEEAGVDPDASSFKFSNQDMQSLAHLVIERRKIETSRMRHRFPSVGGPRPSCADCFRKHIGKAIVQLEETELGYPQHFWLAMANLSEAEAESLTEWPELAREVREIRLDMTDDRNYKPDLMQFFDKIDELTKEIEKE